MAEDNQKQMVEAEQPKQNPLVRRDGGAVALTPQNLEDAYRLASRLSKSGLVPSAMRDNPDAVLAAMLLSIEMGVPVVQGISNIAVVNGRASIWGELATAVIRSSGLCEYLGAPEFSGSGASLKVTVTGKRKGDKGVVAFSYSMEDAKLAGHDKKDTYQKNPKDMIMWKALHRLYKFLWPDVLKGCHIKEVMDTEPMIDVTPEPVVIEGNENPKAKTKPAKAEPQPAAATEEEPKPEKKEEGGPELESEEAPAEEAAAEDGDYTEGMLMKCPYKANADKTGYEYYALIKTDKGEEVKFRCQSKAQAVSIAEFKGKRVGVLANASGEVVKYELR